MRCRPDNMFLKYKILDSIIYLTLEQFFGDNVFLEYRSSFHPVIFQHSERAEMDDKWIHSKSSAQ